MKGQADSEAPNRVTCREHSIQGQGPEISLRAKSELGSWRFCQAQRVKMKLGRNEKEENAEPNQVC